MYACFNTSIHVTSLILLYSCLGYLIDSLIMSKICRLIFWGRGRQTKRGDVRGATQKRRGEIMLIIKTSCMGAVKGSACLVYSCNLSELLPNGGADHPRALHSISATLPSPIAQLPSLFSFSFSLSSSPLPLFFTLSRLKRVFF